MAGTFGVVAFLGLMLAIFAAVVLLIVGLIVTRKHPAKYDPARNAKRYTRPALVCVILIALGVLAFIVGLIGAGIALLT